MSRLTRHAVRANLIVSLGTHLAQGKEATDMGQFNLLGTDVPECCSCGDALGSTPHLSEGDLFCTVECSNAFDERVTESMKRRAQAKALA